MIKKGTWLMELGLVGNGEGRKNGGEEEEEEEGKNTLPRLAHKTNYNY